MRFGVRFIQLLSFLLLIPSFLFAQEEIYPEKLKLPEGFQIEVYARVPNARAMTLGEKGTLFVGSREAGTVYGLRNGKSFLIASGLNMPAGVTFRNGSLYVSAVSRILRFDQIEDKLENPPAPVVVNDTFPTERGHGWKFIAFGPDEKLYVPVGAPCNICESEDKRFASLMRMNPDGSGLEIFAEGIRNTVGFDWHPETRELWFTDNGRDWMGDDFPPDELNHAPKAGMHFGYPYCHGKGLPDPEFGDKRSCGEFEPAAQELGAHVAALGMRFYNGKMFPEEYQNQVFIAEHGSWNRTAKNGYRVMLVRLDQNRAVSYEPFVTGWLENGKVWGRPADVLVTPDGALLISDDFSGTIYRVTFQSKSV